jgi:hypothetical protein
LYSPTVKFIYYLPFDTTTINEAYSKYKTFLDSLAKHAVYTERNDEYYKGYNYVTLRNRLHEIMKQEKNDLYRLIISLYIDNPVRRTSDYTNMLINEKDNGKDNLLIFTKHKKQFVYNYWKNSTKTGTQTHTITNTNAIKTIQEYLNNHPDNKYLLENEDGSSMTETQVETRIAYIAKKYNLKTVFSVNSIRHLLATYIDSEEYNDKQKKQIAIALGTSVAMLERHYIDNKPENIDVEFLENKKKEKMNTLYLI